MKKLLGKKLNKNGFTLAELLIVVAIIAVLVAVAMPLFFGAMDDAKKARDDANIRSVKAAAVNEIFSNPKLQVVPDGDSRYSPDLWYVAAHIDESGNIMLETIIPTDTRQGSDTPINPEDILPATCTWNEKTKQFDIEFYLYRNDLDYKDWNETP